MTRAQSWPRPRSDRTPTAASASPRWPPTYAGDLARARELNARLAAGAASPTLHAFTAYVAGEIAGTAADPGRRAGALPPRHRAGARLGRDLRRRDRLGRAAHRARRDRPARPPDALRGYRDVIDYFARTGNWSHLWTTLRNLALELLRRLGDPGPTADLLDDAADQAPDAPPSGASPSPTTAAAPPTPPAMRPHPPTVEKGRSARNSPTGDPAEPERSTTLRCPGKALG